ncbi:MAG TPA: ORF6N domain-containing protein [Chitinophagaceae bacterium]
MAKTNKELLIPVELVINKIYLVRGQKIMLDRDLAQLYDVDTRRLKEAVRRNIDRFPEDFMFELTPNEFDSLRSQIATLKTGRGQHPKYMPFAFTEQGVAMY